MDILQEKIDDIKQYISSNINNVNFSLEDIDKLIKLNTFLLELNWKDKLTEEKNIKLNYIKSLQNYSDKIKAILHWKIKLDNDQIIQNKDKISIIEYLVDSGKKENSEYLNKNYDMLWLLINSGILKFNESNSGLLDISCLNYLVKQKYQEDYEKKYIHMTNAEEFWITIIRDFYQNTEFNTNLALIALSKHTNPKIKSFPMNVTLFSGNLLDQIKEHYELCSISPIIKTRRKLGIIINNINYNFYDYEKYILENDIYANQISIEFPYLCYAWIDRIEIDVYHLLDKLTKNTLTFNHGKDYIKNDFNIISERKNCNLKIFSNT